MSNAKFPILCSSASYSKATQNLPLSLSSQIWVFEPTASDQLLALAYLQKALETNQNLKVSAIALPSTTSETPLSENTPPGVYFFTSGTTGTPKQIYHNWSELKTHIGQRGDPNDRILLTFHLARMAGLQVFFHCLHFQSTLVIPKLLTSASALVEAGEAEQITHLSVTPSMLKMMLSHQAETRLHTLKQITLGGEFTHLADLLNFRQAFPKARITRIYATSELGACFSTSDFDEGFPSFILQKMRNRKTGNLTTEGELVVHLPDNRKVMTGDYFVLRRDRLVFTGRKQDWITVGGFKVSPIQVERAIRQFPGIIDCRVLGRKNPLLGEVPIAEVVGEFDPQVLKQHCQTLLSKAEIPVLFLKVRELRITDTGKRSLK